MKIYTFRLIIREGNDEFWDGLKGTGCDEVREVLKELIEAGSGFVCDGEYQDTELTLTNYEIRED